VRLSEGEDVMFSYRLVARRRGYEGQRLARAEWADGGNKLAEDPRVKAELKEPGRSENTSAEASIIDLGGPEEAGEPVASVHETLEVTEGPAAEASVAATSLPYHHWGQTWSGAGMGLRLISADDTGVHGESEAATGANAGVSGQSKSRGGRGVMGFASPSAGTTIAVYGESHSTAGQGVLGVTQAATGSVYGAYGLSRSPDGVGAYGEATAGTGATHGVYGETASTGGRGVNGWASKSSGSTVGVLGRSQSPDGTGVSGVASAASGDTVGVYASLGKASGGWAGWFESSVGNGVYIKVPAGKKGLVVAGGTKPGVVATSDGARLMYMEESTEVWFVDYGWGQLREGMAVVPVEPIFAETVNLSEPYSVLLQPYGDAVMYVGERTAEGFVVRSREGDGNVSFSYRLAAKRLGYEGQRLDRAEWADGDVNLYPTPEKAYGYSIHMPLLNAD